MKRFGGKIRDHIVGGTILNMNVPLFDSVSDLKKSNVQMFIYLGTGIPSIVLENNCRLIVLIHDRRMDIIALAFQVGGTILNMNVPLFDSVSD